MAEIQSHEEIHSDNRSDHQANFLEASGELLSDRSTTELRLSDGRVISLSTSMLLQNIAPLPSAVGSKDSERFPSSAMVIPVTEEHLEVGKRTITTGTVRIEKGSEEYSETVDVPLAVETYEVHRVPFGTPLNEVPPVRQEGETTIYPVVEEQVVITTQLILREEVHVTRCKAEIHDKRVVTLRRDKINVSRIPESQIQD